MVAPVPFANIRGDGVFTVEVSEKKSFRVILMMHCRFCLRREGGEWTSEGEDRRRNFGVMAVFSFVLTTLMVSLTVFGGGQINAM